MDFGLIEISDVCPTKTVTYTLITFVQPIIFSCDVIKYIRKQEFK
jgi:hypothetical protein